MSDQDLTVVILAGGNSARFKSEKSLAEFQGRPLIAHMIDIAKKLSSHVMIVVSSEEQDEALKEFAIGLQVVADPEDSVRCALTGAITAFEYTETAYTQLLPVDTPLANVSLLKTLYQLRNDHGAVVPSWPSGYIEPLHSVYLAEHAYSAGIETAENNKYRMRDLLDRLKNVLYISTLVLAEFDSELTTFSNANTEKELRDLEKSSKLG
ncbi:MAG: molybdenum cofactor guanylyltransferase [Candidatus Thorarchaeota archaeon]|jgi:molybdopterin-guanine dinucleotide biosynthesis protein A